MFSPPVHGLLGFDLCLLRLVPGQLFLEPDDPSAVHAGGGVAVQTGGHRDLIEGQSDDMLEHEHLADFSGQGIHSAGELFMADRASECGDGGGRFDGALEFASESSAVGAEQHERLAPHECAEPCPGITDTGNAERADAHHAVHGALYGILGEVVIAEDRSGVCAQTGGHRGVKEACGVLIAAPTRPQSSFERSRLQFGPVVLRQRRLAGSWS